MKRFLAVLAGGVLMAAALWSCGDDNKNPTGSNGGDNLPLQDGRYRMVTTASLVTGDPGCEELVAFFNSIDTVDVSDGDLGDDSGLEDCDFEVDGNDFTVSCESSEPVGGTCVIHITFDGGGAAASTSFNANLNVVFEGQGDCAAFAIPDCTFQVTITAQRISAAPSMLPMAGSRGSFLRSVKAGALRAVQPVAR